MRHINIQYIYKSIGVMNDTSVGNQTQLRDSEHSPVLHLCQLYKQMCWRKCITLPTLQIIMSQLESIGKMASVYGLFSLR